MRELSPYDIRPRHLDGYFRTTAGQFLLEPTPSGGTRLRGRTYYQLDMMPTAYWSLWADDIIHRIHLRVLRHVAHVAESDVANAVAWMREMLPKLGWGALGLVIALLLGLYVTKLWRRLAPRFADDQRLALLLHRAALDRLSDVAVRRAPGETREAFALRVAGQVPSLARLASVTEGRALGSDRAKQVPRAELLSAAQRARQEHARAFPFGRRLLGWLVPWSFLRTR